MGESIPRHWRLRKQKLGLIGNYCPKPECGEKFFPPKAICPCCGDKLLGKPKYSERMFDISISDNETVINET